MKKFLSIFFCCVFCLATIVVPCLLLGGAFGNDDQKTSAAAITYWSDNYALTYAGGTGTNIDPYLISTPEQLALLAHQINHDSNTEKCFKLTNNIDLAGHDWVPIGIGATDARKRFEGWFDGNNKVIFNMTITLSESYHSKLVSVLASPAGPECPKEPSVGGAPEPGEPDRWGCHISVGLFGLTKGAIIENLILSDPKIYDTDSVYVELDPDYPLGFCCEVGNVVGWADSSDLSNVGTVCSNTFGIHLSVSSPSDSSVGGICGRADDSDFSGCFNYADVSGASDSGEKAGGIIGAAYDTNFTDCYNAAPITGGYAVGGIVGDYTDWFNSKMMWRCYNIGAIRSNDRGGYAGGLIGYLDLDSSLFRVYACFNDSTVGLMTDEYGALVGGSPSFDSMRYAFERGSNDKGTNAYNESKAWNSLGSFTGMIPASVEVNTKSFTNTSTVRPNTGSVGFFNTFLGDPSITGWDVSNSTSSRWFLDTPTLDGTTQSPTKLNGQFPILSWAYTTYYLHYNQSLCGASFGFSVESHLDGTSEYNAFKDIAGVNMRRRCLPEILGTKLYVGISVSSPSATKWSVIY